MTKYYREYGLVNALIILFAGFTVVASIWLSTLPDPLQVTRVAPQDYPHVTEVGGKITFSRNVCSDQAHLKATVQRRVINLDNPQIQYVLENIPYLPSEGCSILTFETRMPSSIPPGNYEYRPHIFYELNSFNKVHKPLPKELFKIE